MHIIVSPIIASLNSLLKKRFRKRIYGVMRKKVKMKIKELVKLNMKMIAAMKEKAIVMAIMTLTSPVVGEIE
jgi:hypothetical protein